MANDSSDIPSFEEYCSQARKNLRSLELRSNANILPEIGLAEWIAKKYCHQFWINDIAINPRFFAIENSLSHYLNKIVHEDHQETFRLQLLTIAVIIEVDVRVLWSDSDLHDNLIAYLRFHEFKSFIN